MDTASGFFQKTVGRHPSVAMWLIGALVLVILVLVYYVVRYRARLSEGFGCPRWDPAATAEAQALSTAGSYGRNPTAERRLQKAIESATGPAVAEDAA